LGLGSDRGYSEFCGGRKPELGFGSGRGYSEAESGRKPELGFDPTWSILKLKAEEILRVFLKLLF